MPGVGAPAVSHKQFVDRLQYARPSDLTRQQEKEAEPDDRLDVRFERPLVEAPPSPPPQAPPEADTSAPLQPDSVATSSSKSSSTSLLWNEGGLFSPHGNVPQSLLDSGPSGRPPAHAEHKPLDYRTLLGMGPSGARDGSSGVRDAWPGQSAGLPQGMSRAAKWALGLGVGMTALSALSSFSMMPFGMGLGMPMFNPMMSFVPIFASMSTSLMMAQMMMTTPPMMPPAFMPPVSMPPGYSPGGQPMAPGPSFPGAAYPPQPPVSGMPSPPGQAGTPFFPATGPTAPAWSSAQRPVFGQPPVPDAPPPVPASSFRAPSAAGPGSSAPPMLPPAAPRGAPGPLLLPPPSLPPSLRAAAAAGRLPQAAPPPPQARPAPPQAVPAPPQARPSPPQAAPPPPQAAPPPPEAAPAPPQAAPAPRQAAPPPAPPQASPPPPPPQARPAPPPPPPEVRPTPPPPPAGPKLSDLGPEKLHPTTPRLVKTDSSKLTPQQQAKLDQLPPERRQMFEQLTQRFEGKAVHYPKLKVKVPVNEHLATLLERGVLDRKDSQGTDLLTNLNRMAAMPNVGGIKRDELTAQTIASLSCPSATIRQGNRGTCAATTVQYMMARQKPSEYVRVAAGLTSEKGEVTLASGQVCRRVDDSLLEDNSGRMPLERIMQSAFMDFAAEGSKVHAYSNVSSGFTKGDKTEEAPTVGYTKAVRDGLLPAEIKRLAEGAMGEKYGMLFNSGAKESRDDAVARMQSLLSEHKRAMPAAIQWREGKHAILVTDIKDGRVHFRNPWGDKNGTAGQKMDNADHRIEAGGMESITLQAFTERLYVALAPEAQLGPRA